MWESEKLSHKCREPLPEPDTPPLPAAEQLRAAVRTLHLRAGRPAANDIDVASRWVLTAGMWPPSCRTRTVTPSATRTATGSGMVTGTGSASAPHRPRSTRQVRPSRRIHDVLPATRDEPYVTLMVNPSAGDGKVHELYGSWGYKDIGRSQPSPASPVLTVMIRAN